MFYGHFLFRSFKILPYDCFQEAMDETSGAFVKTSTWVLNVVRKRRQQETIEQTSACE